MKHSPTQQGEEKKQLFLTPLSFLFSSPKILIYPIMFMLLFAGAFALNLTLVDTINVTSPTPFDDGFTIFMENDFIYISRPWNTTIGAYDFLKHYAYSFPLTTTQFVNTLNTANGTYSLLYERVVIDNQIYLLVLGGGKYYLAEATLTNNVYDVTTHLLNLTDTYNCPSISMTTNNNENIYIACANRYYILDYNINTAQTTYINTTIFGSQIEYFKNYFFVNNRNSQTPINIFYANGTDTGIDVPGTNDSRFYSFDSDADYFYAYTNFWQNSVGRFELLSFEEYVEPANIPPTPSYLITPCNESMTLYDDRTIYFSWTNSTDADNDTISYTISKKSNLLYTNIFSSFNDEYVYTTILDDWRTANYSLRVTASDGMNETSTNSCWLDVCVPAWTRYDTACVNGIRPVVYYDANNCGYDGSIPSDNNTQEVCTEEKIIDITMFMILLVLVFLFVLGILVAPLFYVVASILFMALSLFYFPALITDAFVRVSIMVVSVIVFIAVMFGIFDKK